MTSRRHTQVLAALGCFLAPIVVVRAAVMLLDRPGPVAAMGAATENLAADPPPQAPMATAWTNASRAAARHAAEIAQRPSAEPPLYYAVTESEFEADSFPENEPEPQPQPQPPLAVVLDASVQMIMTSDTEEIALVDGRPYRVGEVIRTGDWIVQEINSRDRAVVFRHAATGRIEIRRVPITR
jgi:hypothetical protein